MLRQRISSSSAAPTANSTRSLAARQHRPSRGTAVQQRLPNNPSCGVASAARSTGQQQQQQQHRGVCCRAGFGGFGGKAAGSKSKDCPCGSGRLYSECCQVFHKSSSAKPSTPEQLVRARYSAFVKREFRFLRATSHPDNPALRGSSTADGAGVEKQCTYEEDLAVTVACIEFCGLEVVGSSVSEDGSSASVEVVARLKRRLDSAGRPVRRPAETAWRERAALVREPDVGWLVLDVQQLGGEEGGGSDEAAAAATAGAA